MCKLIPRAFVLTATALNSKLKGYGGSDLQSELEKAKFEKFQITKSQEHNLGKLVKMKLALYVVTTDNHALSELERKYM